VGPKGGKTLLRSAAQKGIVTRFELATLVSYDDEALVAEIRRTVGLLPAGPVTRGAFDRVSKVSSSTLVRRLGGWEQALDRAGLGDRYFGRRVSAKMRQQHTRTLSDDDLLNELRHVAEVLGTHTVTMAEFNHHSPKANSAGIKRRFGSWKAALERAGLSLSPLGRRYSDSEYFENILSVWTHHGRQPKYREMDEPPSTIPAGAYEAKFGGWRRALGAFVERVNADRELGSSRAPSLPESEPTTALAATPKARTRTIPLGLRYDVLRRDRFKCVLCGASPAVDPTCQLHVDHIVAYARGGTTEEENLRYAMLTLQRREGRQGGGQRRLIGSPGLTREGQPRLPHHRTCGSAYGGSDQTRAFGP
jgi:hypothetical protein